MACVNKGIHDWCRVEKRLCLAGTERTCKNKKPKTNADRIRSMSDEGLAEWLCSMFECRIGRCPACEMCSAGDNGLIKWLQQPWEEE